MHTRIPRALLSMAMVAGLALPAVAQARAQAPTIRRRTCAASTTASSRTTPAITGTMERGTSVEAATTAPTTAEHPGPGAA